LFLAVLLVGTVSAGASDWFGLDNFYNITSEDKRTIEIWDGGQLGPDTKLATVHLDTDLIETVGFGMPQKVFQMTYEDHVNYSDLISDFDFYNVKDEMNPVSVDVTLKYQKWHLVDDYEAICEPLKEGQIFPDCRRNDIKVWKPNGWSDTITKETILDGKITVSGWVTPKAGDLIEWIPTIAKERITAWAVYNATGGTISTDGNYTVHTFTSDGIFNITSGDGDGVNVTVLVVAGGGGGSADGGGMGGGGGAGGVIYNTSYFVAEGGNGITVTVGQGGASSQSGYANNGTNSSFGTLQALGGGAGGIYNDLAGSAGGSGGGGGQEAGSGGAGYAGQGNNGGDGINPNSAGAGGGGCGAAGSDSSADHNGGNGGAGCYYTINGTNVSYGGGGGGAAWGVGTEGSGGVGGGGTGAHNNPSQDATNGTDGLGGGGGGGGPTEESGDGGNGVVIVRYLQSTPINQTVTLNSPVNYYNSSSTNVTFNCSSTDDLGVLNLTLVINGADNHTITNTTSGQNLSIYHSLLFADGSYNWTCRAADDISSTSATTRYFNVDANAPIVNVTAPYDHLNYYFAPGTNISINFTATDANLGSCWYSWNNGTNNISIPACADQNFTANITSVDNNTIMLGANDSYGNINQTNRSWGYMIFQDNLTYNNLSIEGNVETFTLDFYVLSGLSPSSVDLVYNSSNYTASFSASGQRYNSTRDLTLPSVSAETNMTFYWSVLINGSTYNSSSFNQTIQDLDIDDCSSYSTLLYNYTLIEEEQQTNLSDSTSNLTIESSLRLYNPARDTGIFNFSQLYNNTNLAQICINLNLTNATEYSADSVVKYGASNYETEYYNIINFSLTNSSVPQHIYLFDLKSADSTEFKITFKDDAFQKVEGALVHIQRQYVTENNTFKVVELPITDSNGQTMGHFVEKDIVYNILITNSTGGRVLGTFNNIIAFCEDATIGECEINLNAFSSGDDVFDYEDEVKIAITNPEFNETTRVYSFDFYTYDGSSKNVSLHIFKYDQLGNTTACNNELISSSGTLSCTIPAAVGNSSIQAYVYVDDNLLRQDLRSLDSQGYGVAGYFALFLLILILVVMFSDSKTAMVISTIIGVIAGISISLIEGTIFGAGSAIMFLIVVAIIMIWKLNKDKM
jgi:hypothetical protein